MKQLKLNIIHIVLMLFVLTFLAIAGETTGQKTITIRVDGLSCPFCAYGLEKKLLSIDGVDKLNIDVNSGKVELFLEENASVDYDEIKEKVEEAGFTLREIIEGEKKEENPKSPDQK